MGVAIGTDLVPHHWLLDGGEVLQGRQEDVTPLRTADVLDEVAQLLAQGNEDLVLVFDRLCSPVRGRCTHELSGEGQQTVEEGDELLPSALGAQGQGDGRKTSDGIETEDDIVVLCLVKGQ